MLLRVKIAIVYDCLYPHSVGGGERWYRVLAEELVADDNEVEYVTRKHWDEADPPTGNFSVAAVSNGELYRKSGPRNIFTSVRFGLGSFFYFLRNSRRFDVVNCASFPYFSLLGLWAGLKLRRSKTQIVVDWHECWTGSYWRNYAGLISGSIGYIIQKICIKIARESIVFSDFVKNRLIDEGYKGEVIKLPGLYQGPLEREVGSADLEKPYVVYAGRHTIEKRVTLIPAAIAEARKRIPNLGGKILGDGPLRRQVIDEVKRLNLSEAIECPGFVSEELLDSAVGGALCFLLPSEREGYGMVVVEATSHGTPVVVVPSPESGATDLIEDGINGYVPESESASDIAAAIQDVLEGQEGLRASTIKWFAERASDISMDNSAAVAAEKFRTLALSRPLSK